MTTKPLLEDLTAALYRMAESAGAAPGINAWDLSRVLRFLDKMIEVVDQSFEDIYGLLIRAKYLTPQAFAEGRHIELQQELELLLAKSTFRDATEICRRLRHLREHYETHIAPLVHAAGADPQDWSRIWYLLNEYEGAIIIMITGTVSRIQGALANLRPETLPQLRDEAGAHAAVLRRSLDELRDLRNRILGSSGRLGLLELTLVDPVGAAAQLTIIRQSNEVTMGDTIRDISNSTVAPALRSPTRSTKSEVTLTTRRRQH